jgi:hypothetical protein
MHETAKVVRVVIYLVQVDALLLVPNHTTRENGLAISLISFAVTHSTSTFKSQMHSHSSLLVLSLVAFCTLQTTLASSSSPNASVTPTPEDEIAYLLNKYSRAHSYHDSYPFDACDGWQTANASDLSYKYNSSSSDHKRALYDHGDAVDRRRSRHGTRGKKGSNNDAKKNSKTPKKTSALGVLTHTLDQVWKGIKGIGKQEKVIITWYVLPIGIVCILRV